MPPKSLAGAMQGIPTADQEALQAPAIDPVFLGASGMAGGMGAVRSMFLSQLINSVLMGRNPMIGNVAGLPGGRTMATDASKTLRLMNTVGRATTEMPE